MTGNKGYGQELAGMQAGPVTPISRPSVMTGRATALNQLAQRELISRDHLSVDPATCRIWDGHNRDYASLTAESCADLLDSLRSQGRQEIPAIVRRVSGDPLYDFEVVCGARRHWSVTWLRQHDYPDFKFVVEPRELTDEEAFRVADLENRNRRDLSDYERAVDYAKAIQRYYDGNQTRMVARLQISQSWLSRYLQLAKLPIEVIAAFGTPHAIDVKHAAQLAPLLRVLPSRERILSAAEVLAAERKQGVELPSAAVVRRLVAAADDARPARINGGMITVRDADMAVLVEGKRETNGAYSLKVSAVAAADPKQLLKAVSAFFHQIHAGTEMPSRKGRKGPLPQKSG